MKIISAKKILKGNDHLASINQKKLNERGIFAVNLLGSPGAGKTTLLECLLPRMQNEMKSAVVEGDLATSNDAERIEKLGVAAVQINTEGACHLDAAMVSNALDQLDLDGLKLMFIENVGNLVCPAGFQLGENRRVVVLSVAEGDDKVAKYPPMFQNTDAVVLNKVDLLEHFEFDPARAEADIRRFAPEARVFRISARTGEGIEDFRQWLSGEREQLFS